MSPARKNTDDRTGMDPDMPLLRADLSRPAVRRTWRGLAVRGGGQGGRLPSVDEFFGTSTQVCGGFWPFAVDMALPVEGCTGRPVAHDRSRGVLRSDQLVPCRHHRTAQHVRDGTAGHRQINVRPPTGVGHGRSWRACDFPGDLKPDYADLTRLLGGQVIRLGSGIGSINPLDPGGIHTVLRQLSGQAQADLTADWHERRSALMEVLLTISRTGREEGRRTLSDVESNVLSTALRILHERTRDQALPPVIADLRDLIRQGPAEVRAAAVFDAPEDDAAYQHAVRDLLASLHGLANPMGRFGRLFSEQTTEHIDLSRPVDFDISALAQAGDDVVAAVLAATWSTAFAAKNAADMLADAGLSPRRNHVIVLDEMHRALRASPLMVDRLDLLTRLNRQWGVGQIMITHTFADLMCLDTTGANQKARGFVERSKIKVLGALTRTEVQRYLRGESGLPVSRREEDLLADWSTPTNFAAGASLKGVGKFLVKLVGGS